jgi:hypothetical protein
MLCALFIEALKEMTSGRRCGKVVCFNRRLIARGLQVRVRVCDGQSDAKSSAVLRFVRAALDRDVTGMLLHDAVGDGESQACSFADAFRREERIVDARDVFGRDPCAGVGNLYDDGFARRARA